MTSENIPVGETIGSYKIIQVIGYGGVGNVYMAEHPIIGTRVAIKVLHSDFAAMPMMVERFVREARASNAISSPHMVRYLDFGRTAQGQCYAVMEYLEGTPLDALLERTRFDTPRALTFAIQMAEALAAAHATGVIHRDFKPSNVFIENKTTEFVRLLDFGIAKLVDWQNDNAKQTSTGVILCTPCYCAPEQATGQPVDHTCDIYALGAVIYEMLYGKPLFEGNPTNILREKIIQTEPMILPNEPKVPSELKKLLLYMLQYNAADRPQRMTDIVLQLKKIATTHYVAATSTDDPSDEGKTIALEGAYRAMTIRRDSTLFAFRKGSAPPLEPKKTIVQQLKKPWSIVGAVAVSVFVFVLFVQAFMNDAKQPVHSAHSIGSGFVLRPLDRFQETMFTQPQPTSSSSTSTAAPTTETSNKTKSPSKKTKPTSQSPSKPSTSATTQPVPTTSGTGGAVIVDPFN